MNTLYENPLRFDARYGEAEALEAEAEGEEEAEQFAAPFSEAEEMERAAEALEVSNEAELEQFLGDVISSAAKGIGGFLNSDTGRALVSQLKPIAKQALPAVGSALGGMIGGPTGAKIGAQLAPAAGQMFGLELEGLSSEDREFEVARNLTRLAGSAAQHAAFSTSPGDGDAIAQAALVKAARHHAPGIVGELETASCPNCGHPITATHHHHHRRWMRRGNTIIVLNA